MKMKKIIFLCFLYMANNDAISYKMNNNDDYQHLITVCIEEYTTKNVNTDISPVIVLLNALKLQIDELGQDQSDCCEMVQEDFAITLSALSEIVQTFSAFDDTVLFLIETVATLTSSIASFTAISSDLALLQETIDVCCNALNDSFQQTWTILGVLSNESTNCCNVMANNFNSTWTLIEANFDTVFDLLTASTMQDSCQAILISTPTTITASGSYCLSNNITGTIMVNAHNVVVDLNDYTVSNGQIIINAKNNVTIKHGILSNALTGTCALSITGCSNSIIEDLLIINPNDGIQCGQSTNIIIKNCIISGAQKNGIDILGTVTALHIEDFEIINTSSNALYINGNVQDLFLQNGHIKFSNGIRAEAGLLITNAKFIDLFVEGTPAALFPMIFLGTSNNFFFDTVHIADAGQGIRFSSLSNSLLQHCVIKNIATPLASAGSAFRLDGGNNNQFIDCIAFSMVTTGSTTLDAFKITNVNNCIFKNCSVEGVTGVNGATTGFNSSGSQRITIENCLVQNIITSSQATGFYTQSTNNVMILDCIANVCSSYGYFSNGGANAIITNCIANGCTSDGFRSVSTTNVDYEYCCSNNNGGAGFNVNNALCGYCESSRNTGFGFNGNATSTAYNCCAALNTAADYSAITSSVQALGAGSPKVGYSISI